ncbi:immunoglobulin-like domain-containing protein, partial [Enterococcus sp. DIV0660C]|uniref:immunoglobulin-like domain-containing protein n=1 Tax=Enterococcus sp. DIV0660C TaxID=2230880 RepID=UPI001A8D4BD1
TEVESSRVSDAANEGASLKQEDAAAVLKLIDSIEVRAGELRDLWRDYSAQTWINPAGYQQDLGTNHKYMLNQGDHRTGLISVVPTLTDADRDNFRNSQQKANQALFLPQRGIIDSDYESFVRYLNIARANVNNGDTEYDLAAAKQSIEDVKAAITKQRNAETWIGTFITTHFLRNEIRILNLLLDDMNDIFTSGEENEVVINASDKELHVNDPFDPLEGVTATDKDNNDITSNIKVIANNVDTSKEGFYSVTYEVTADGKTVTKTIYVTVVDDSTNSYEGTITANDFTIKQDGYIKGTYTGDVSTIKVFINGEEQAKISATGSPYQYYVGNKITSVNDSVTVVAYGPNGKELDRANVNLKDKEAPSYVGTITANDFTVKQDGYVKGTYTGDVSSISVIINGKEQAKISATGSPYQYYVGSKITSVNDKVTVVAYGPDGKELDRANVNLKDKEAPNYVGTITANDFTVKQDGYVKGTYTGDVSRISVIVNGKELTTIPATGSPYQYYVGSKITSVNDKVTVVAYGPDGKELDRANVNLKDKEAPSYVGTITANDFTIKQDGYVKGTYTGDVSRISVIVNGKELTTIPATSSPYQYYVGSNITSINDKVTVVAYGPDGKELDRANVNLKEKEKPKQGTITANEYEVGGKDAYIHGKTTGDVAVVKMFVNGLEVSQRAVNSDGTYDYYARPAIESKNDTVVLVAYDDQRNELARVDVKLV